MNDTTIKMFVINIAFWLLNATVSPRVCLSILEKIPPVPQNSFFRVRDKELVFYRLLGIRRWKDRLPVMRGELDRKHLGTSVSPEHLHKLIAATCSTEVIHLVCAIVGFLPIGFVFLLKNSLYFLLLFSAISSANFFLQLPFIAAQRYNRARFLRVERALLMNGIDHNDR